MDIYELNQNFMNSLPYLSQEEIEGKTQTIKDFFFNKDADYYMMLCKEQSDYTLFYDEHYENSVEKHIKDIIECLNNRGKIKAIDLAEDGTALEFWIEIDDINHCYFFFPYDKGVIKN